MTITKSDNSDLPNILCIDMFIECMYTYFDYYAPKG